MWGLSQEQRRHNVAFSLKPTKANQCHCLYSQWLYFKLQAKLQIITEPTLPRTTINGPFLMVLLDSVCVSSGLSGGDNEWKQYLTLSYLGRWSLPMERVLHAHLFCCPPALADMKLDWATNVPAINVLLFWLLWH